MDLITYSFVRFENNPSNIKFYIGREFTNVNIHFYSHTCVQFLRGPGKSKLENQEFSSVHSGDIKSMPTAKNPLIDIHINSIFFHALRLSV